jgi:hypothetical protein
MKCKIVIARYNEDLSWLKKKDFHYPYLVYNKGSNSDFYKSDMFVKEIKLKNVGRETHSYFTHIVNNYDTLDDLTIFVPGSVESKNKYKRSIRLMQEAKGDTFSCFRENIFEKYKTFKIDNYLCSNKKNSALNPDSTIKKSKTRPFGKWYNKTFKHVHKSTCFTANSMFALTKETILRKPKTYYESLLQQVNDNHNHEEVHYFERAWDTVFHPYSKVKYLYNK